MLRMYSILDRRHRVRPGRRSPKSRVGGTRRRRRVRRPPSGLHLAPHQRVKCTESRNRMPGRTRWPNRDPIGEWGGASLYRFAENAPGVFVDRLGLEILVSHKYGNVRQTPSWATLEDAALGGLLRCEWQKAAVSCETEERTHRCWYVKSCAVQWEAHIYLNRTYNGRWGGTSRTVYGHEQGHYRSRIRRVEDKVITPLKNEQNGPYSHPIHADGRRRSLEASYRDLLQRILREERDWTGHEGEDRHPVPAEPEPGSPEIPDFPGPP